MGTVHRELADQVEKEKVMDFIAGKKKVNMTEILEEHNWGLFAVDKLLKEGRLHEGWEPTEDNAIRRIYSTEPIAEMAA